MRSRGSARLNPSGEVIRWYGAIENIHEYKLSYWRRPVDGADYTLASTDIKLARLTDDRRTGSQVTEAHLAVPIRGCGGTLRFQQ